MLSDRQTQQFNIGTIGEHRFIVLLKIAVRLQFRQCDRVVDPGLDARLAEVPRQFVASRGAHDEQVEGMAVAAPDRRDREAVDVLQPPHVSCGDGVPAIDPAIEMTQLDVEDGCLQPVQTAVTALEPMIVLIDAAVIRDHPAAQRELPIVRDDRPSVAVGAEILPGVEAEGTGVADGSDATTVDLRAMRLRAILDHLEIVFPGDRKQRVHVARVTVEMDCDDRSGARRDPARDIGRVERVIDRIDVGKNHAISAARHRFAAGDEGIGGNDDLRPLRQRECLENDLERVGAVADTDAELRLLVRGEIPFEALVVLAADERGAANRVFDSRVDLALDAEVLGMEIKKFDHLSSLILRAGFPA